MANWKARGPPVPNTLLMREFGCPNVALERSPEKPPKLAKLNTLNTSPIRWIRKLLADANHLGDAQILGDGAIA
jgi:hypothetical protein